MIPPDLGSFFLDLSRLATSTLPAFSRLASSRWMEAKLYPDSPPTPEPATDLDLPPLDLSVGEISVKAGGDRWSAPLGRGVVGVQAGGGGEDAQGYIEVIPYDTRRPNVPEVAWQNKINGWVLVAFRVTEQGTTRDVRVLDANPRGVFEDAVVSAVRDWRYRVTYYGSASRSVVLTQKVEVRWENFPANLPNVD